MAPGSGKWRSFVGALKDKASLSKATIAAATATVAVVRATTHGPSASAPDQKDVAAFLSFGFGSRRGAASAMAALAARLGSTHDPTVALKCLLLVHRVLHHGGFILKDQLVSFLSPKALGGRNRLNLSGFRRRSSDHESWAKSSWVRWYARVLELLVSCPKALGDFVHEWGGADVEEEKATASWTADLAKQIGFLACVVEEARKAPEGCDAVSAPERKNGLLAEVVKMVDDDVVAVKSRLVVIMKEIGARMDVIDIGDSVELMCSLKRLEDGDRGGDGVLQSLVADVSQKLAAAEGPRVERERVGESARIRDERARLGLSWAPTVRIISTRWDAVSSS